MLAIHIITCTQVDFVEIRQVDSGLIWEKHISVEGEDSGDVADELEDLAFGFNDKLLADASAVSGVVCQFCGSFLEYDPVFHRIQVILIRFLIINHR